MTLSPEQIERQLHRILPTVAKPGRYVGGEYNQITKDWEGAAFRVALAFPDIYDLGMSNLGLMVLYDIINKRPGLLAERVFCPWSDMEDAMRRAGLPLYALESKHALADFDLIGVSLPYESLYTNALALLDLAGLPVRAEARDESMPLVIAGGHATFNPEPVADFIDAFVIGEGEEVILEIVDALCVAKSKGRNRSEQLRALAQIGGVYVPRFYDVAYHADGRVQAVAPNIPGAPVRVVKRIVPILPPPPTRLLAPNIDIVHNRAPIEIMRGCTRGCRFCHAGMVNRPVRERPVEQIIEAVEAIVRATGFEEIGLLSLSSSDYRDVHRLVDEIGARFRDRNLSISLPSLRIETTSAELMDGLADSRRGGFTLAPEAATEHMRSVINKYVPDAEVLETAREIFARGWRTIKLYFMIGHAGETEEDVRAIAELARAVLAQARPFHGKKAQVNVGVSTFVPKPHTPFQWVPLAAREDVEAKQALLRRELHGPGLKLSWNDYDETRLEAFLSRGDRRVGAVIEEAWRRGARFDAWQDCHKPGAWAEAFEAVGLDPGFYLYRQRALDEVFPWDHISPGVKKAYLVEDYLMAQRAETRADCREQCFACGILPEFIPLRRETPVEAWRCPPVSRQRRRTTQGEKELNHE
ncbi:MAG: TIGR03960 family B12-binding radical SAM protein [Anaerolineae bacterium]|nr:TIGR03960 family B12-binding radical SAM protein [Anaerolineae bacterium]